MTKTVKYYSSDDVGAPQLYNGGWGHIVNLYRKICQGYNEQAPSSISYSNNDKLITVNFDQAHNYKRYQTIIITDTISQYNNVELFIIQVAENYIKCKPKTIKNYIDDTDSNSGIKCKVAPLGMIETYTNSANKSAFKFEDATENVYMVINDTMPTAFVWSASNMLATPSVYMCKNLIDINGDSENITPYNENAPTAYKDGEWKGTSATWSYGLSNIFYQFPITDDDGPSGKANDTLTVSWRIIGNGEFHYLYIYMNTINKNRALPILYTFGKFIKKYDQDNHNFLIKCAYNGPNLISPTSSVYQFYNTYYQSSIVDGYQYYESIYYYCSNNIFTNVMATNFRNILDRPLKTGKYINSATGMDLLAIKGLKTEYNIGLFTAPQKYSAVNYNGTGGELFPSIDGKLKLSKIDIYEADTLIERGTLPGALWIHHKCPYVNQTINKIVDEDNNESYIFVGLNYGYMDNATSYNYKAYLSYNIISLDEKDW